MNKHSPGRLLVSSSFLICDQEARIVANCVPPTEIPELSPTIEQAQANTIRLAACWNALEECPTCIIEQSAITLPNVTYEDLLNQRNETLALLEWYEDQAQMVHDFSDLECFFDDPETHDEYRIQYLQRRNARSMISQLLGKLIPSPSLAEQHIQEGSKQLKVDKT